MTASTGNGLRPLTAGGEGDRSFLLVVESDASSLRLDHFLLQALPQHSRSGINRLIHAAEILVNDQVVKAGYRLRVNDRITVHLPPPAPSALIPEQVDFSLLHEDEDLLVVSKPPGLVVHPAAGHHRGTLVHGLLHHCSQLPSADAGRPGIVHRLDKDTSGVMLIAKTEAALRQLMADFKNRHIRKMYHAILLRCPRETEGRVVAPIGRHPINRKKMAVRPLRGKHAATRWRVTQHFANGWCLAEIEIETGRTHQIRVHMGSINSPVAGDALYGGAPDQASAIRPARQMLHASSLELVHPLTGVPLTFTAPIWEDMRSILEQLSQGRR